MPAKGPSAQKRIATVITGTPGTGKKSIAPLVARALGVQCIGLNDLAKLRGLVEEGGIVDTSLLARELRSTTNGPVVVYGHLAPYSVERGLVSKAVVLRCDPAVLKKRLADRGYPQEKVVENVEAELIGLIAHAALRAYGRDITSELDTTNATPVAAAREAVALLRTPAARTEVIDWTFKYNKASKLTALVLDGQGASGTT